MANRLTHKRRKCVKSPNIFRDKQEYSSLYTISSRSALSEMSSKNADVNRVFKGHQKGDSVENVRLNLSNQYPKLPNDVSLELQQKVYSGAYKSYYNDRTQFIKNKFDSLSLDQKVQYPKPYCPMHINANRRGPQTAAKGPPPYTINRLEESYWAKWKPNKCDDTDNWQVYENPPPCRPYSRQPTCTTSRMLKQDCLNILSQANKQSKPRCCDDKRLQIIRDVREMQESNSSDMDTTKKIDKRKCKSKPSCCTCNFESGSESDDEKSSQPTRNKDQTDDAILETSQEEYEALYNEMYTEYESDLMNRISEYEMQREQEEMEELEKQLAEQKERESQKSNKSQLSKELPAPREEPVNLRRQMPPAISPNPRQQPVYDEQVNSTDRVSPIQSRPPTTDQTPQNSNQASTRTTPRQSRSPAEDQIAPIPIQQLPNQNDQASIQSGGQTTPRKARNPTQDQRANTRATPRQSRSPAEDQIAPIPIQQLPNQNDQASIQSGGQTTPRKARNPAQDQRANTRATPRQSRSPAEDQTIPIPIQQLPNQNDQASIPNGAQTTPRKARNPAQDQRANTRVTPRQSRSPAEDQITPIPIQQLPNQNDQASIPSADQKTPRKPRSPAQDPPIQTPREAIPDERLTTRTDRKSPNQPSPKEQSRPSSNRQARGKPAEQVPQEIRARGGENPKEMRTSNKTESAGAPRVERNEREDQQRKQKLLLNVPDQELTPHLTASNEYLEPEIPILKHTDSFIINSRRQKDDRRKRSQPKFLKLTKTTPSPPPVKGHTYPLRPALKKEKQSAQPTIGFSRPLSPNTPKARTPNKTFQPTYLLR